jgi:hypothetical protein
MVGGTGVSALKVQLTQQLNILNSESNGIKYFIEDSYPNGYMSVPNYG